MFKSKQAELPEDYIYVDIHRLTSYIEQIKGSRFMEKTTAWDVSLTMTGPQVRGQQARNPRPFSHHEMIQILLKYLEKNKQLAYSRPTNHKDQTPQFVIEEMNAVKAVFSTQKNSIVPDLKEVAVWVSKPSLEDLTGSSYVNGTFLYLIEAYWESDKLYQSTYSGYSALALLAHTLAKTKIIMPPPVPTTSGNSSTYALRWLNGALSNEFDGLFYRSNHLSTDSEATENFFARDAFDRYFSNLHPVQILKQLGASIFPPRKIRSLYRKRYITDEMIFKDDNGEHRSNDVVGYPVFVSAVY